MKKDLNYYLSLQYPVEIVPIHEEEGGGYLARLPQFGILGVMGDGKDLQEALANLEESKKVIFSQYLEDGIEIPKPEVENDEYSGRFVARIPKFLHRELSQSAKKNGVSLNQYVCTLLAMNLQSDRTAMVLTEVQTKIQNLNQSINNIKYHIEKPPQIEGGMICKEWMYAYEKDALLDSYA